MARRPDRDRDLGRDRRRDGLVGKNRVQEALPPTPENTVESVKEDVQWTKAKAQEAALWSASGYVGAFMRAANIVYETPEGRPFWKLRPLQILVTLVMILLLAAVLLGLVLSGPVVGAVAGPLGIGSTAQTVFSFAKWPIMLIAVILMFAVLFHAAPNVKLRGFRWVTPGAVLALVVWILASVIFAFYVANFGSYDKTYGALGGMVILLVWMWLTNIALLLGMELNAERERARELAAGVPRADREIQLEPRDEPKTPDTT